MAAGTRTETISTRDGRRMRGHLAIPESGTGPGIVVVMEVFGVGDYVRDAAERLAALGYLAIAPDLYHRTRPGATFGRDEAQLQAAMAASGELDHPAAVADLADAMDHLATLPELTGPVGVLGFCLGGTLAFELARAASPAVAVCYYGSGIPDLLDASRGIACPVLLQWGAEDPFIPVEQAQRVCAAARDRDGWECHVQPDGGHAFDNWDNPMFHRPEAAARAWAQTREFLHRTLAPGAAA